MVKRIIVSSFSTNCYLLSLGDNKCVIIDPGADGEKIEAAVRELGLEPVLIVCTHGHLDHIAATDYLIDTFSGEHGLLPLAASAEDKSYFGPDAKAVHQKAFKQLGMNDFHFEMMYAPIPAPDILLHDGDTVPGTDLQVLSTPGHTPGSISLLSKSHNMIFTGDCIMADGIGRTDLPGGDSFTQENSIYSVLMKQRGTLKLMPGHGPASTLERFFSGHHSFSSGPI